jgi:hypothetical protein
MSNLDKIPAGELEEEVQDDAEQDSVVAPEKYAISSFGIDFDVEGLVRRLRKDEIFVPHFQRTYVWKQDEASQFIESLLLGLPVPGVFLAKERDGQRMLIIDGQQRLKSLQFFYDGFFNPKEGEAKHKVFELIGVQPQLNGRTYKTLEEDDVRRLDNSVIHATIIKQESPAEEEDTSLYYIFGRLNTGGRKLNAQEIRSALYHGRFDDLLADLNMFGPWRAIYGRPSDRLKDQELILRFLALYFAAKKYRRPMEEFLNAFMAEHQKGPKDVLDKCMKVFQEAVELAQTALGGKAFRPSRAINAAVFDSTMVGLARRLEKGPVQDRAALRTAHKALSETVRYQETTERATADEANVAERLKLATEAFAGVP